jgi:hypothetical protein
VIAAKFTETAINEEGEKFNRGVQDGLKPIFKEIEQAFQDMISDEIPDPSELPLKEELREYFAKAGDVADYLQTRLKGVKKKPQYPKVGKKHV